MDKLKILEELDKLGVGYCSKEACEDNIMGLYNYTWEDVLSTPKEILEDELNYQLNKLKEKAYE